MQDEKWRFVSQNENVFWIFLVSLLMLLFGSVDQIWC